MADDRPTLPRCRVADRDGGEYCRAHRCDAALCRDEMAEALPSGAELAAALHREDITGRAIHEDALAMQVPSWGPEECDVCQSRAAAILAALREARRG